MVELLNKHKHDPNPANSVANTPLHFLFAYNYPVLMNKLMSVRTCQSSVHR